jgi:methionyl-tRNA formyltransferase
MTDSPVVRWAFMGSDPIALPALEAIATDPRSALVRVWTQPDRPHGRGQRLAPGPIKQWAAARGIPVSQPERMGDLDTELVRTDRIDLVLVMAYGQILRTPFLQAPRLGTFNLHTSLLPAYRGASPIQTAVASGEVRTGVTLMRIVPALDAGPVLDAEAVEIRPDATALDIEALLSRACVPLMVRNWPALLAGTAPEVEQDASRVTFCRKLRKEDGVLDFHAPAKVLASRINGLFPWPACYTSIADTPLKLGGALALEETSPTGSPPGTFLGLRSGGLAFATGSGVLLLLKLQRPGGKLLPAEEFLRGFRVPDGTVLPSHPMPELVRKGP